ISACLVSHSPAISACLVFCSSPPFISLIHFRFGRCRQLLPIKHGFKPQSHTHPLPDCSLPSPMRDIPAFICGLTFCYRLGLFWTILLVAPLVITSACPRLRFQSLHLDSLFDCVSVGTLSCQFFCLPLCWTESSNKELHLSELYCNFTCQSCTVCCIWVQTPPVTHK
ncbi:hypothetical protein LDENG_00064420, partial [Lucifuga dentata]